MTIVKTCSSKLKALCSDVYECQPENHNRFTEKHLVFDNLASSQPSRNLERGWYRFDVKFNVNRPKAKRMLEISEVTKNVIRSRDWKPCGVQHLVSGIIIAFPGLFALGSNHPLKQDGRVRSTVQLFDYQFLESNCNATGSGGFVVCNFTRRILPHTYDIYVRNCGEFYVYFLSPIVILYPVGGINERIVGRYCAGYLKNTIGTPVRQECHNFLNASDAPRRPLPNIPINNIDCADSKFMNYRWIRFDDMLQDTCSVNLSLVGTKPCGGYFRGWLKGDHPKEEQVIVQREFCFSTPTHCNCEASISIDIINCGGFYIYKRYQKYPLCAARACTVKQKSELSNVTTTPTNLTTETKKQTSTKAISTTATSHVTLGNETETTSKATTAVDSTMTTETISLTEVTTTVTTTTADTDPTTTKIKAITATTSTTSTPITTNTTEQEINLCQNYETVIDDTRFFDNFSSLVRCDVKYKKAIRFVSSNGENLKLNERCIRNSFIPACESAGYSWLETAPPTIEMGVSLGVMCFAGYHDDSVFDITTRNACMCKKRQLIQIQNCSSFYVYELNPVDYSVRQCMYPYCRERHFYCASRYCLKGQGIFMSTSPQPTTTVVTSSKKARDKVAGRFAMQGTLQITNPKLNGASLTQGNIADRTSTTYGLLENIVVGLLKEALQNMSDIEINALRIGSLIADYTLSSDNALNVTAVRENLMKNVANKTLDISNGGQQFTGVVNSSSVASFRSLNFCAQTRCDKNAACFNQPSRFTFTCLCSTGYQGDGFQCVKTIREVEHKWSNNAIIIVSVLFAIVVVVIIILAGFICIHHLGTSKSYKTGHLDKRGYDDYMTSTAIDKYSTSEMQNIRLNMYVAAEQKYEDVK